MPPIPIYTKSPINAAKADGVTPQTSAPDAPTKTSGTTTTQLEARYVPAQPTSTQQLDTKYPPPPQPGAVPVASGAKLPPPPKAGEVYHPEPTAAPQPPQVSYPPQMGMSVQPPPMSQRGTATGVHAHHTTFQPLGAEQQQALGGQPVDPAHPPGYQQNVNAADFTNQQRAAYEAQNASKPWHQGGTMSSSSSHGADDEGVWNSAVKWAQSAGEKIAAAESEVWRKINKE